MSGEVEDVGVVVLGGGVAGLTVGAELGRHSMVLEREARPGGLVRTENFDGYWFDHVLHLLHLPDREIEQVVRALLGDVLERCPPRALIDIAGHAVRYPFQLNLGDLPPELRDRCLADFAALGAEAPVRHYGEQLLAMFGASMCELFYFPYNRKQWRRPLDELATTGFQWNLQRPSLDEIVRGSVKTGPRTEPYNKNGWYPRPLADAPVRGMEVLSRALAARVGHLRTGHTVTEVDTAARTVRARHAGGVSTVRYRACVSTLPLPVVVELVPQIPAGLRAACRRLPSTRVRSVALSVRGRRPAHRTLWHYYPDPATPFTRLVYMHNFDPASAPENGWGLLAEVPERADEAPADDSALTAEVAAAARRVGALAPADEIIDSNVITADPAYVVFTEEARCTVASARAALDRAGVVVLGRYGRWEYSSIAQVMTDARVLSRELRRSLED
ncbi:protoporphyrinogen/coproporphyrinogen oxidase [Nonomuraea sp. NPDC050451]|uniref:protoporphyrinogen/coproporphyrinogen oxidase n=1 Tax=Nonomuraea sp. NPDC050451 TaxID=3364364 RepID=UPI00379DA2F7